MTGPDPSSATPPYPFSAIVGHDRLRLAMRLCAVRPEIGGVLIRGEKGPAKSTAVRALAAVLTEADPGATLVELPIGATEDRQQIVAAVKPGRRIDCCERKVLDVFSHVDINIESRAPKLTAGLPREHLVIA